MRKLLGFILKVLARRAIDRYQPTVIGVTGSVGKTTAKEAVFAVLSRKFWVRKNEENYNNEIGVPLAILGIRPEIGKKSKVKLLVALAEAFWSVSGWPKQKYPKFLVLELAADRPGDIEYLVDIARPKVGIVTAVGEVPVHVEFYASPQDVAREKAKLISSLPANGLAVLNFDDQTVLDMREKSGAKVATFGFSNLADLWASDISYFATEDNKNVGGLSFKMNSGNNFIPARINKLVGPQQIYGILAAATVGLHFGINLVEIATALENMELPHRRMNLLSGIKNSAIIDDTYNASPLSMHAALDALRDFARARGEIGISGRRIAILGDMKELGRYEVAAHRAIGNLAAERCDMLLAVGSAAKFIADSAVNQMPKEKILLFNTADEVKSKISEIVQEGDVVLVKGSRAMRMERVVEEIRAMP